MYCLKSKRKGINYNLIKLTLTIYSMDEAADYILIGFRLFVCQENKEFGKRTINMKKLQPHLLCKFGLL